MRHLYARTMGDNTQHARHQAANKAGRAEKKGKRQEHGISARRKKNQAVANRGRKEKDQL